jgi:hypothetical protein
VSSCASWSRAPPETAPSSKRLAATGKIDKIRLRAAFGGARGSRAEAPPFRVQLSGGLGSGFNEVRGISRVYDYTSNPPGRSSENEVSC